MQGSFTDLLGLKELVVPEVGNSCVGKIIQITAEGQAVVDYPGNPQGPIMARSVMVTSAKIDNDCYEGNQVLLFFENGNPALPIIVGIVRNTVYSSAPCEEATFSAEKPLDVMLDGKKIVFDAKEEIVLRCGKSSVTLKKDGKIVIKGTQITSRSSGTNKIKGASVSIN